jgi:hypothetical protein
MAATAPEPDGEKKGPRWSAADRKRVERALLRHGMLLIQGQEEIPSIADLLADRPVTTRGFSWDYVPAWDFCDRALADGDAVLVKLFRGRRTLVHRSIWPLLQALALSARKNLSKAGFAETHAAMLDVIEQAPGIAGEDLKRHAGTQLRLTDSRYRKLRTELETWLCIVAMARTDVDYHTHDAAWFPWSAGRISSWVDQTKTPIPAAEEALRQLREKVPALADPRADKLLPVLRVAGGIG